MFYFIYNHGLSCYVLYKQAAHQQSFRVDFFVSWGSFSYFSFVFLVYVILCLIVFGCQYQCN